FELPRTAIATAFTTPISGHRDRQSDPLDRDFRRARKSGHHPSDLPVNIVGSGGHHPSETSVTFRRNTQPRYKQREKRCPVLGPWVSRLALLLAQDYSKPTRERRTGKRLFDALSEEGYRGSYLTVQRFVRAWKDE